MTIGIKGWYKGLDSQLYKSVLTQALLFASKDYFEKYTLLIFAIMGNIRGHKACTKGLQSA